MVEIGIRDLFYILVIVVGWAVSLSTVYSRLDSKGEKNASEIERLSKFVRRIVLDDAGQVRLVSAEHCKAQKLELKHDIELGRKSVEKINGAVEEIRRNILLIMYHLKIDKDITKNIDSD